MAEQRVSSAVGDAAAAGTQETDINGARTAVGVPHPENRPEGQALPAVDLTGFELDDYDDDKQGRPTATQLPPDQDAGESFPDIADVGEPPDAHQRRAPIPDDSNRPDPMTPTVDNQVNQPERFRNPRG